MTPPRPLAFDTGIAPPRAVLTGADRSALPLHDARRSGELERLHALALPPHTLMQRAGLALARLALAVAPHSTRIDVIAGPGNNGGDGFEAAALLHAAGQTVRIWWLGDPARQPADASASRQTALALGVPVETLDDADCMRLREALCRADRRTLVIDALLGRGLNRPADDRYAELIAAINASAAAVLAVDLPSGLNGDTGNWPPPAAGSDPAVIDADWTLALLSPAPGLFTGTGRDHAGDIWWHDLAVDLQAVPAQSWLERGAALDAVALPRRHVQHKGSFGDVWVIGGAASMAGAAWLAARAALQCGSGRVYVDLLDPHSRHTDTLHPELMLGAAPDAARLATATVVAGCGGGTDIAARLPQLLAHAARLVLDADALNALAGDRALDQALRQRGALGRPTVLTPHPLEAARLLGCTAADVQRNRFEAAQTLAERWQAVVVLKGSGTVIAAPGRPASINSSGNAALATPGSGDVLAGCLGGLWSRHASTLHDRSTAASDDHTIAHQATLAACHLHGQTAQALSPHAEALPAASLAEGLGAQLRRIATARPT
jgi:hydroxyethylthiazole kinase-like uncharacterized protein yjeF